MKAMILAAGLGSRLGDITASTPKILVDINGQTVLERILRNLQQYGFDDVIINVHYLADRVEEEALRLAAETGIRVSFSDERDELLETGGGLHKARNFFDEQPFLVYNGDILTDIDLSKMYNYHVRKNASATIATRERPGKRFFLIDSAGDIKGWSNSQSNIDIITTDQPVELREIASMAISIYSPEVFNYMQEGKYTMTSIILELSKKKLVTSFQHDKGYWIDIGSPEKLMEARRIIQ